MTEEVQADLEFDRVQKWTHTYPKLSDAIEQGRQRIKENPSGHAPLIELIEKFDSLTFAKASHEKHSTAKAVLSYLEATIENQNT